MYEAPRKPVRPRESTAYCGPVGQAPRPAAGLGACPTVARAGMVAMLVVLSLFAGEVNGRLKGRVLVAGTNRVFILDSNGTVVWEHSAALAHDAWMLPNGNVLFADGKAVAEVTPDHRVAFEYRPAEQRGGGAFSCQRLANGNTVIGENSTGRVLEVDATGKIVFTLQTAPAELGAHHNMRMVRKLENGNYLVCHSGAHVVKEYAPDGKVVWEVKTPNLAFAAIRTRRGTTLVSTLEHIFEYDRAGKVVWQFANTDLAGVAITNMTGMHLLPNGNIAVGCYRAYSGEIGSGLFEITRNRRLVWRYADPKADSSMMGIERLASNGKPMAARCLR